MFYLILACMIITFFLSLSNDFSLIVSPIVLIILLILIMLTSVDIAFHNPIIIVMVITGFVIPILQKMQKISFLIRMVIFSAKGSKKWRYLIVVSIIFTTFLLYWVGGNYLVAHETVVTLTTSRDHTDSDFYYSNDSLEPGLLRLQIWMRLMLPPLFMEYDCFVRNEYVCDVAWQIVDRMDYYQPIYNYELAVAVLVSLTVGIICLFLTHDTRKRNRGIC